MLNEVFCHLKFILRGQVTGMHVLDRVCALSDAQHFNSWVPIIFCVKYAVFCVNGNGVTNLFLISLLFLSQSGKSL